MRTLTALLLLLSFARPAAARVLDPWRDVPLKVPGEGLVRVLQGLESRARDGAAAGCAALALGQFHYARGEYRQAADAFERAAGRLGGEDRGEARYWSGLAFLGLGDGGQARAAFADAERSAPARRSLACLGLGQALELVHQPARAIEAYARAVARDPGEAGAPALERFAALVDAMHRAVDARHARERLALRYPASLEAARWRASPPPAPITGSVAIQLGAFVDRSRALALAEAARRAGFTAAAVLDRPLGMGPQAMYSVRLGTFASRAEGEAAGERAARVLGTAWRVTVP